MDFTITREEDGYIYGNIEYMGISTASAEALNRIRKSHGTLVSEIEAFQSGKTLKAAEQRQLTRSLIEALVQERYDHFNSERAKLGNLNTSGKVLAYIKLVALHYRDLMSIHPFPNGNGRSMRLEALCDPLDKEGIPKPRLNDPDRDVLSSPSVWVREVERAVTSNYFLYADMITRVRMGLPYENSVELLFPAVPRNVGIHEKNSKKRVLDQSLELIEVDPNQFGAYFRTRVMHEPELRAEMAWDPILTFAQLREDYKNFVRRTHFFYTPQGGKRELVAVPLIDPDFYDAIGDAWSNDYVRYRMKMRRWYRDELTWRGMGYGEFPVDDAYVLKMFTRVGDHSIAEGLRDEFPKNPFVKKERAKILRLVRGRFDEFNSALVNGTLWEVLRDQVSEAGGYDDSPGFSTSRKWGTGRKYAWKSEVEGERGTTEWEVNKGTRVLIGARPANHDVVMSRYSVIDGKFSYVIRREDGTTIPVNRQDEIMGVGAVDPDAIQVVQLINEKGNPTVSYVRNPVEPSQIWKVKGRWDPSMGEPSQRSLIGNLSLEGYYY